MFDPSLSLVTLVSAGEFPSIGADLVLRAEEHLDGLVFAAMPSETDTLDLLTDRRDLRSENGTQGIRRFILLAILFGAALRYLTSAAFCEWAADVFAPPADTEDTAENVAGREGWLPQGVPALAPRRRKTSRTHSSLVAVLMVWGFWCTALAPGNGPIASLHSS